MPSLLRIGAVAAVALAPTGAQDEPGFPTPWGIGSCHIHGRSVEDFERWIPPMAEIGLRFQRSVASSWGAVNPEPGRWDWANVDAQLDYLEDRGLRSGALLIGSPGWHETVKPGTLPVDDLDGWSEYVFRTVKHLSSRVRWFEVWNEPPNFTGKDQTPEDYAKVVAAAYRAAKRADPDCRVGLAAKSVHVNYLEQVIRSGAEDHFDWISLHPYEVMDGIVAEQGMEPVFLHIVPTVRKMLAAVNPAKREVPILFTELGCDVGRHGAEAQARATVKAYTMAIAQGVACVQWFEGRDGDSGPLGLLDREGTPRPAVGALTRLIEALGPRPEPIGRVTFEDRHHGFVFKGVEGPVMVVWASGGRETTIRFDQEVKVLGTIDGTRSRKREIPLDGQPLILSGLPEAVLDEARANRDRPVSWGGDFSEADEVSITFGEKIKEQGLHTRAGDAVAEAVVAYGGSARAGGVPGGNLFVVDPNFLCYESVPIEITAEVRRNEANDNAGFKLVYESRDGFKTNGGWVTVPDNQRWHTITWRIDDPCFVNYWGYNFTLNSDGNEFNKYYIRRVSVKRLDR